MAHSPKEARRRKSAIRLWTFAQAKAAIPYITSVVRSLREHTLESQKQQAKLDKITGQSGRPTRDTLIEAEETRKALHRAQDEHSGAAAELGALDIMPLDPLQGTALVPFVHDDQLAWYVFDLHEPQSFKSWRYHSDPEETRRRLTASQTR
ncbi:MAG: DUF2203 family protein [Gemmataceae bacterium]|nr:DUF2203 family protein [Gemmataceae bacterium]